MSHLTPWRHRVTILSGIVRILGNHSTLTPSNHEDSMEEILLCQMGKNSVGNRNSEIH